MEKSRFMNMNDVREELGVSESKAYKVIKQLNDEMTEKGYHIVHGRVNRRYFEEAFYGMDALKER